jgi:hypothetical protein
MHDLPVQDEYYSLVHHSECVGTGWEEGHICRHHRQHKSPMILSSYYLILSLEENITKTEGLRGRCKTCLIALRLTRSRLLETQDSH